MKVIELNNGLTAEGIKVLKQWEGIPREISVTAARIVADVRMRGDDAVLAYGRAYDGIESAADFLVPENQLEDAYRQVGDAFKKAMDQAIVNIERYHERLVQEDFQFITEGGSILGSRVTPLERVAVYVPGGKAAYPSTVLMCAVPAILAGVKEICIFSPNGGAREINPYVGAAAYRLGIRRFYRIGGAQAVAAAAYGTDIIPKVNKIVGPGNAYVAAAKKEVFGAVDIDMIAGPSEIAVLADAEANPEWVAADLLSQAEHDEMARCFLITDSRILGEQVAAAVYRQLGKLQRASVAQKAIKSNGYILITPDLDTAAEAANLIAPEHLEINTRSPMDLLPKIRNAGAIFLGPYSAEPIGDYLAGPNHVLPTYGTAAFFSPLSVSDFQKRSSLICYSREDLLTMGPYAVEIAEAEGLTAHAAALKGRLEYV